MQKYAVKIILCILNRQVKANGIFLMYYNFGKYNIFLMFLLVLFIFQAQSRVAKLEEEKMSMEVELEDILKKLASVNNELEEKNHRVSELENELKQEKMKRQVQHLGGKVSVFKKSD